MKTAQASAPAIADAPVFSTIEADLKGFADYHRIVRNTSPNTLEAYRFDLKRFAAWVDAGGIADPSRPRHRDLDAYVIHLRGANLSARSIGRHFAALKSFVRWLVRQERQGAAEVFALLSAVDLPKCPKRLPATLSHDDIEKLLAAKPDLAVGEMDRYHLSIRDKAIISFAYSTGCRVAEISDLQLDDLDLDDGTARVVGKGDKQRIVFLNDRAIVHMKAYLDELRPLLTTPGPTSGKRVKVFLSKPKDRKAFLLRWRADDGRWKMKTAKTADANEAEQRRKDLEDELSEGRYHDPRSDSPYVFVGAGPGRGDAHARDRLATRTIYRILLAVGKRAGLENWRELHPHMLRHSFASHLLDGGADLIAVRDMMGHVSVNTTSIYCHTSPARLKDAYRKAHPMAQPAIPVPVK